MAIASFTAAFNNTQDTVAVAFTGITTNPPTVTLGACTSDGSVVALDIAPGTLTNTGCTLEPTSRFTGSGELVIED